MEKISALLITYNEERNIERFLKDADYADEIIIVDSYSTDNTIDIAKKNSKVKIFFKEFIDFTSQKNFAIDQASFEWITFFDADEHIPEGLRTEILKTVNSSQNLDAYYVHRRFYFKEKYIRFSGMQSDKAIRVFKKSKARYRSNRLVHELIDCDGKVGILKNSLDHYSYANSKEYQRKLNSYSKLRAKELALKGLKPNIFHFYIKPAYRFVNHYFIRLGFLDGIQGYVISKLHAESVYKRYVFLNEIYEAKTSEVINKNT